MTSSRIQIRSRSRYCNKTTTTTSNSNSQLISVIKLTTLMKMTHLPLLKWFQPKCQYRAYFSLRLGRKWFRSSKWWLLLSNNYKSVVR